MGWMLQLELRGKQRLHPLQELDMDLDALDSPNRHHCNFPGFLVCTSTCQELVFWTNRLVDPGDQILTDSSGCTDERTPVSACILWIMIPCLLLPSMEVMPSEMAYTAR